jgi:HSP20 family protein
MALLMKPEPFSREIDRMFDAFFGQPEQQARRWVPPMDLVEAEDHFVLKADLPGLTEGDVNIEVQDGSLMISGERHAEHEQHERGWYRIERAFGGFNRSLTLPDGVDPDRIEASFSNGVLEVRIPKPEERKPRRIAISSASGNGGPPAVEGGATVEGNAKET